MVPIQLIRLARSATTGQFSLPISLSGLQAGSRTLSLATACSSTISPTSRNAAVTLTAAHLPWVSGPRESPTCVAYVHERLRPGSVRLRGLAVCWGCTLLLLANGSCSCTEVALELAHNTGAITDVTWRESGRQLLSDRGPFREGLTARFPCTAICGSSTMYLPLCPLVSATAHARSLPRAKKTRTL